VVQVQHTLALARLARARQRAAFAGLVAGHGGVVRDLVAGAPDDDFLAPEGAPVRVVRREDSVLGVAEDEGLGQRLEEGHQLRQ